MRYHLHDWSKWSDPIDTTQCYKKVQSRYCLLCNKTEVEQINQPFNTWFSSSQINKPKEQA